MAKKYKNKNYSSKDKKFVSVGPMQAMVNSHSKGWLRKGFDWVYENEILAIDPMLKPGQIVQIISEDQGPLGVGILDEGQLKIRRFKKTKGDLDLDFFSNRLQDALSRRRVRGNTTAWRWVHGENDDLPGIRIDVWGVECTLLLESASLLGIVETLVEAMVKEHSIEAVWLIVRHPKGEQEALGCIWGEPEPDGLVVLEHDLQYLVHPERGLDAGLFCDMREMRQFLKPYYQGAKVLNLFCYTGAFSISAMANGSDSVTSIDLSRKNIARLEDNIQLNSLGGCEHTSVTDDCFNALDHMRRKKTQFDLVIADPPSFSHSSNGTWSVEQNLSRLVASSIRVTKPGGHLVIATNNGKVTPKDFVRAIVDGSSKCQRRARIVHQYSPPSDFPAAVYFPESRYLKCWCLQV